jgi:hypothetical protein
MEDLDKLKVEIFDLQIEMAIVKKKLDEKIKQFNIISRNKDENKSTG